MGSFLDKIRSMFGSRTVEGMPEIGDGPRYNEPGGFFGYGGASGGLPNYGSSGFDGSKWYLGMSATGASPVLDHYLIRQNARSVYHDTTAAHGVVNRYAQTVVGKGLRLESTPDADTLGITPEKAEEWGRKRSAEFHMWAKSKKCERAEQDNFYQQQYLGMVQKKRDGEFFSRLHRSRRTDLLNPLQLQFVDASMIRGASWTNTYGYQVNSYDGIVRDNAGRETGYLIYTYNEAKKNYVPIKVPARGAKSNLLMMLHCFRREYADQGRGHSDLAHAIQDLENFTDFTSAHIKQAINQSNIALVVEPSPDEDASNPFDEMTNDVAAPLTSGLAPLPGATDSDSELVTFHPAPEVTMGVPGSAIVAGLRAGEKLKTVDKTAPSDTYRDFTEAFISGLSASMGMPGEVLMQRFGNSYSASRALLVMFWRIVELERAELASDYMDPIYESWLEGEIAAGRVSAPGWSDPRMRQAWLNNNWIGDPMPNIDPMRTASADRLYVEMGAQTINRVARNLNGTEAKSNMAILDKEFEMLPEAPWLNTGGNAETDGDGGQKNPDNDPDDKDKDDE